MIYNSNGTKILMEVASQENGWQAKWIENPLKAEWGDRVFYAGNHQRIQGRMFQSVEVKGYYGDPWMKGWSGVGPSPVAYSMKALMGPTGKIYRPAPGRTGYLVEVTASIPIRCLKVGVRIRV